MADMTMDAAPMPNRPLIIKRKKVVVGGGHHGGAWKVAYADFVTAMMAFFMLMWLLNATTEQQRKGLADYFAPSIPINRISGGGDGTFGGNMMLSENESVNDAVGGRDSPDVPVPAGINGEAQNPAEVAALRDLERELLGIGGESLLSDQALRHVITRLTDEGLVIEVFSLPGQPLFAQNTAEATNLTRQVLEVVARAAGAVLNPIGIGGHLATRTVVLADNPVWDLSHGRAEAARLMLQAGGVPPARIESVAAHADRNPATSDPTETRNDRLVITILRTDR